MLRRQIPHLSEELSTPVETSGRDEITEGTPKNNDTSKRSTIRQNSSTVILPRKPSGPRPTIVQPPCSGAKPGDLDGMDMKQRKSTQNNSIDECYALRERPCQLDLVHMPVT